MAEAQNAEYQVRVAMPHGGSVEKEVTKLSNKYNTVLR